MVSDAERGAFDVLLVYCTSRFARERREAVLAGSLVPTTLGAHRFWEMQGPAAAQQRTQFLKNAAILGGLILVANAPTSVHPASEIA